MPDDPNILHPEWHVQMPEPPFRSRGSRVAHAAGARELGMTLYEIDPGGAIAPYHAHHGNEEMLIVLSGAPELRTPAGRRTLEPGSVVAFPRGAEGAHSIRNRGKEPARVLLVSTMHLPDVAEHLDTGAWLAITGPAEGKVFPAATDVAHWDAITRALEADAEA